MAVPVREQTRAATEAPTVERELVSKWEAGVERRVQARRPWKRLLVIGVLLVLALVGAFMVGYAVRGTDEEPAASEVPTAVTTAPAGGEVRPSADALDRRATTGATAIERGVTVPVEWNGSPDATERWLSE